MNGRKKIAALRVLDPTQDHLHIVNLTLLLGRQRRLLVILMCLEVFLEFVPAFSPPPATFSRTEYATRKVHVLVMPAQLLLTSVGFSTCTANEGLLVEGRKERRRVCVGVLAYAKHVIWKNFAYLG